jgi:phage/plasmid-associated DNA primase
MFRLILFNITDYQVFFYLYGPSGTGKSLLVLVLTALVGHSSIAWSVASTVTTTMKLLQQLALPADGAWP